MAAPAQVEHLHRLAASAEGLRQGCHVDADAAVRRRVVAEQRDAHG
jgi:hypothetical protein